MIETERLALRAFEDADRERFAQINADPRVGQWLGGPIDRVRSDALVDRINAHIAAHGFGVWAAMLRSDGTLVGAIGLQTIPAGLPPAPGVELAWRLAPEAQGQGLASEGAAAALAWGFAHLGLGELTAFTASGNLRSQAVMRHIGMTHRPERDFDHPALAEGHPLRRHVLFARTRIGPSPFAGAGGIG